MKLARKMGLRDNYSPPVILTIIGLIISTFCYSQTYNPTTATVTNKPIGISQATPTDARSYFFDGTNFLWRAYQNVAEVKSYLNLSKYRVGQFIIVVDSGGSLQSNGSYIGGVNNFWMFKDGTADGNLVELNLTGSGGCVGCLLAANNLSDLSNAGLARSNLGLGSMATQSTAASSTDLSGVWPSGLTVNSVQGANLANLRNYLNLTNTPAIPPQLNPTQAGQMIITGTYPNLTFNSVEPTFEQTLLKGNTTSQLDSINIGTFIFRIYGTSALGMPTGTTAQRPGSPSIGDSRYNTDSLFIESWTGSAWKGGTGGGGGGGGGITALTGDISASGSGSVVATLPTINSNVFGSNTFLKFAVNGKGQIPSAVAVGSGDITGALGFTPYNATNPAGYISSYIIFNKGAGFRWVTGLDSIKTFIANAPLSLDSTSNAFSLTIKADTTTAITGLATQYDLSLKQAPLVLTTTGVQGVSTFLSPTLNVPNYGADTVNSISGLTTLYQNSLNVKVVNLVATQNATTNSVGTSPSLGLAATLNIATTSLAGLLDTARARFIDSAKSGLKNFSVYFVQGLHATGGDTAMLGGTSSPFTIPDTIATAGQPFLITGLPHKTPGSTDSAMIEDVNGKILKSPLLSLTTTGTSGASTYTPATGVLNIPQYTGGSGGPDSAVLAGYGMTKVVSTTNIILSPDSAKFATLYNEFKNSAGSDTLIRFLYGIPEPDVTGGTSNGTPIPWKWLTSGGGHTLSPDLDSCIFVNSSGHVLIGFPTAQGVAGAVLVGDEQTYPLNVMGIIGNQDNYEFIGHVQYAGLASQLVGSGSGGLWNTQHASLEGWTLTVDTSTQGKLSFDLIDPTGMFLGSPNDQTQVIYNGANAGFHFVKAFVGLTRGYLFYLCDAFGDTVRSYSPQATDRVTISNGSITWQSIDFRSFLTSTNPYLASGLPNFWFMGTYRAYPDSLKIIRPLNFQAIASGTAGQINVSWNAVANAANFYELDRSTQQNFAAASTVLVNFTNVTTFNDTGLVTGTKYWYRLRASRVANVYSGWEERGPITAP